MTQYVHVGRWVGLQEMPNLKTMEMYIFCNAI